jgi:ribosomal protein S18 acetylase RimI-like enzyme
MNATVFVRPARPAEFPAVADLVLDAYRTLGPIDRGSYEDVVRDVAGRAAHGEVLVAELDGRVIGSVTFAPPGSQLAQGDDPLAAGIRMLGVAESARGRGAGEALARACVERAVTLSARRVRLLTESQMTGAQRLYERLGFRRDPSRDLSPIPGIDLFAYVLDLPGGR